MSTAPPPRETERRARPLHAPEPRKAETDSARRVETPAPASNAAVARSAVAPRKYLTEASPAQPALRPGLSNAVAARVGHAKPGVATTSPTGKSSETKAKAPAAGTKAAPKGQGAPHSAGVASPAGATSSGGGKVAAPAAREGASPAKGAKPGGKGAVAPGGDAATVAGGDAGTGPPEAGAGPSRPHVQASLLMPEPPAGLSKATQQRIDHVQQGTGAATSAHAALPPAASHVADARAAVAQPPEEANAKADADLVAALNEQPAPSPELEELCKKIYEVIRAKRPPDEKELVKADPQEMARAAGQTLDGSIQGDVQKVGGNYQGLQDSPEAKPQGAQQALQPAPGAQAPATPDASAAAPDAVPAQDVSLQADAAANASRMQTAGMNTPAAQAVKSGPVAEARGAQAELQNMADTEPAAVLAGQQASLTQARTDMAALQKSALEAVIASRQTTVQGTEHKQHGMVGTEAEMRVQVGTEARSIFTNAQKQVRSLLQPLTADAMKEWTDGVAVLSTKFKASLKVAEDWIKERHAGGWGTVVAVWDEVAGLPDSVQEAYDKAEKEFGDGVCDLVRGISRKVNGIVAACEVIISGADKRIASLYGSLPDNLKSWAEGEVKGFQDQLTGLRTEATKTRDGFNKDLAKRAGGAVQEVRQQIATLRQQALGVVGRAAEAINAFLDNPAKAILEGLLELLGIPPAAFWAVVEKIKAVIDGIAADPMAFANNLLAAMSQGFGRFFDNIGDHLLKGMLDWLLSGLKDVGVDIPKDLSLKSIVTFFLQLMGISWTRIRKLLVKHVGEENVALIEKAWSFISMLFERGVEGMFDLIKDKLNPKDLVDQVIQAAKTFIVETLIKQVSIRIIALFNPAGAIAQAVEAIYRVLKWIFTNAAKIFRLIETVVNGAYDLLKGNITGMAKAVEKALAGMIAPVIDFLADYIGLGDLPDKISKTIGGFQAWIEGILDDVIGWLVEKGKALLKSLGLGGDDKKKDGKEGAEGESVKSLQFGGEAHQIKARIESEHVEMVMASEQEDHPDIVLLRIMNRVMKAHHIDPVKNPELKKKIDDLAMKTREKVKTFRALDAQSKGGAEQTPEEKAKIKAELDEATEGLTVEIQDDWGELVHEITLVGTVGGKLSMNDIVVLVKEDIGARVVDLARYLEEKNTFGILVEVGTTNKELTYLEYGESWILAGHKPPFIPFKGGVEGKGGFVRIDKEHRLTADDRGNAYIPKARWQELGYDPQGNEWKYAGHLVAAMFRGDNSYSSGNIVPMTTRANYVDMPAVDNKIRNDLDTCAVYDITVYTEYSGSQKPPTKVIMRVERLYPTPHLPAGVDATNSIENTL